MTIVNMWIDRENEKFILKVTIGNDNHIYRLEKDSLQEAIDLENQIMKDTRVIRTYNVTKK